MRPDPSLPATTQPESRSSSPAGLSAGRPRLYILAGGRSSRFGADKARAEVDGQPLIRRIAEALQNVTEQPCVVAAEPGRYADLGLTTCADPRPHLGPLAGVATALRHAAASDLGHDRWLLITACDWINPEPACLNSLRTAVRKSPGIQAAAFFDERWQPLPMLIHADALPGVQRQIDHGRMSLWRMLEAIGAARVAVPANHGPLLHANTPAEFAAAIGGTRS